MKSIYIHTSRIASIVALASAVPACSAAPDDGPKTSLTTTPTLSPASTPVTLTDSTAAAEKQNYLSNYVQPGTIQRSFHAAEGMWVDCVDVNRQPSMLTPQMAGQSVAQPPPLPSPFGWPS
jgi:hypothetical protein